MSASRTRGTRWLAALVLAGGLGLGLFGAPALVAMGRAQNYLQTGQASAPTCPYRARTGRPCLGCGGTRALALAARGELRAAARLNPLGAWAAVVAWLTSACAALAVLSGNSTWLRRAAWVVAWTAPPAFAWALAWWWRALPPGPVGP